MVINHPHQPGMKVDLILNGIILWLPIQSSVQMMLLRT